MSGNLPEHALQRASDADRERVIEVLQAAVADGRLDLAEFDQRATSAYQAKTFGELAPLTADLGGHAANRSTQSNELVIQTVGSSTRRRGRWVVPRKVVVNAKMGTPILDFTEAELTSRDVEVQLNVQFCTAKFIVPDGTAVDVDDLVVRWGKAKIKVREANEPSLRLRITGETNFGSVVVNRPRFFNRRSNR